MKRTYLVLIITMLVIGFAAVTTNLVLSGTLKLGFNSEEFEEGVLFTKAESINGTASIQENDKTINYQTYKLDEIGEESVLDYDITNKSNQYDADVTINCELKDASSTYSDYIELSNEDISGSFTLSAGETKEGRVKVKLKKSYVASDNTQIEFTCTIVATAKEKEETVEYKPKTIYTETALNGADPVLEGNSISTVSLEEKEEKKLIPVTIDDEGKVTYADITEKWYDYENQQWANAVILSNYNNIPKVGEEIAEEDIESYFVWIPKYRYRLWNVEQASGVLESNNGNSPRTIEIKFGLNDTTNDEKNSCATPLNSTKKQALSGEKGECDNGEWMTHPAFITMGVNGFWVGKFETGYKDADSRGSAQKNSIENSKVTIIPNSYSWREITPQNIFEVSYNYNRNLDSHMMKNTEWGAVAYLSHSIYGINKEVAINNNSDFKTGYATASELDQSNYPANSGKTEDVTKLYNTKDGIKASTTGNITGIYDMSGGAYEYMASYVTGTSNIPSYDDKYFDIYDKNSNITSYNYRILGDATGEMGPFQKFADGDNNYRQHNSWYNDASNFVDLAHPWFTRSGDYPYGVLAGQFHFDRSAGAASAISGFRIILSPQ